jgi:hypothetical protein
VIITTRTTGDRRNGTIAVTADGTTFGYAYHRGTGRARHDLTVYPSGGALAASPRLSDIIFDTAVKAAEAGPGEWTWRVTEDAGGWSVEATSTAVAA